MIFQPEVVQDGPCSDCVNSGKVHSGTVLILGNPEWSVLTPCLFWGGGCSGTMLILGDPELYGVQIHVDPCSHVVQPCWVHDGPG